MRAILFCYCLFAFGSTFSIALAQMSLGCAAVLFTSWCITHRYNPCGGKLAKLYVVIGLLTVWRVISSLASVDPIGALNAMRDDWLYCAVPIGIFVFQQSNYRHRVLIALLVGTTLVSIYAYIQNATGFEYRGKSLPPAPDYGYRVIGTFPHQLTFGNYYAVAAMTFLGAGVSAFAQKIKPWHTLLFAAAILTAVASGLSYSRGSMIAMIPAMFVACWLFARQRALLAIVCLIAIVAGYVYTHPGIIKRMSSEVATDSAADNFMGRPFIWSHSLRVIGDNPVFGTGPGQFKQAYVATLPPDVPERGRHSHAHNDVLTFGGEAGVVGALLFGVMWIVLVLSMAKGIKSVAFLDSILPIGALFGAGTFLVSGLTEATFFDEEVRQLLMLVWAFGLWPLGSVCENSLKVDGKSS